jgi:hypothetical protein
LSEWPEGKIIKSLIENLSLMNAKDSVKLKKPILKKFTSHIMPLDPKIEKRIDTIYRNTKQVPILIIISFTIFPIALIIGAALGPFSWLRRRNLLGEIDSGILVLESAPVELHSSKRTKNLSTTAKVHYIRSRKHALLIPLYLVVIFAVIIFVLSINQ